MSAVQVADECCPKVVTETVTTILRESLLLIRMAGSNGDTDFCAIEANHVHNLPSLLRCYDRAKLERYLTWAQTQYAAEFRQRFGRVPSMFVPEWNRLQLYLSNTEAR